MILFSVVEVFNKLLGLYITAYLARLLPVGQLGVYLSGLIVLGYALEISFFGSQNRHNADYALDPEYLKTTRFAARRTVTVLCSLGAMVFLFLVLTTVRESFHVWPLLLVLAWVPLSFDYVAYGSGRSQLIVIARLVSQLIALGWVLLVSREVVATEDLYWGLFLQTSAISLVIAVGLLILRRLAVRDIASGVVRFPASGKDIKAAVVDQGLAFTLRLVGLALISGELLYLGAVSEQLSAEVAASLRLVQLMFPFVVFYIDSRVKAVEVQALAPYVHVVLGLACALLVASPACVIVLYGKAYARDVVALNGFLVAFLIQALVQYLTMLSLKAGKERELLVRCLAPVAFGFVALVVVLQVRPTLAAVEAVYFAKALLFLLMIPWLSSRTRILACCVAAALFALNHVLDAAGYYAFVTGLV